MRVIEVPAAVSAAAFLLPTLVAWRRSPVCARVMLATAAAFLIAAVEFPGQSVDSILAQHTSGLSYLVAVVRIAGLAAFLIGTVAFVRERFASPR